MIEVAFKVKPIGQLNREFCMAKREKNKFEKLALAFFGKYFDKGEDHDFAVSERLSTSLTIDDKHRYGNQLCAAPVNDRWVFFANSDMQKRWAKEVASKINWNRLRACDGWWTRFGYTYGVVEKDLWENEKGRVYGYLKLRYGVEVDIARNRDVRLISLSEYYAEQLRYLNGGKEKT